MATFSTGFRFSRIFVLQSLPGGPFAKTGTRLVEDHLTHLQAGDGFGLTFAEDIPSRGQFIRAMDAIFEECRTDPAVHPLLHIEAHGVQDVGFRLEPSGDVVTWNDFTGLCRRINRVCKNNLVVVLVSCFGYRSIVHPNIHEVSPYFALLGPEQAVFERDILSQFSEFYRTLFRTGDITASSALLSPEYQFLMAEKLFSDAIIGAFHDLCLGKSGRLESEKILTKVLQMSGNRLPITSTRHRLKRMAKLDSEFNRQAFDDFKDTFLMSRHPENAGRFNVSFDAIVKLLQEEP